MKLNLKIFLSILFILGALLGLAQWKYNLFAGKTTIQNFAADPSKPLGDYFQQASQLGAQQNQTATTTFLAVGDIMLSRNVAAATKKSNDYDFPYRKILNTLTSVGFSFANLESPISGSDYFNPSGSLIFNAPVLSARGLRDWGFDIVNLANNHAFDQGIKGLESTIKYLNEEGVKHEGTGDNLDEAWTPAVVTSNGLKICFVGASYASANDGGKTKNDYVARMEDTAHLKTAITTARQECDFVVATMHGGIEYTRTPNKTQTDFAHTAIDDGADIVIGAHPHWVQTVEQYAGKYIFYSLGNFIFDQNFSQDTKEGLTLKIQISKNITSSQTAPGAANLEDLQGGRQAAKLNSIELLPVIIDNSQPRPATADEAKKILQKIGQNNAVINP